jgi:hypothetical protein
MRRFHLIVDLRRRLPAIGLASLLGVLACRDSPTQPPRVGAGDPAADVRPRFAIAEPTLLNRAWDSDVELELLTTGELRILNRVTGTTVYAPLDIEEMETVSLLLHGLRVGDAEYQALHALNPLENAPPGFEPFSAALGPVSSAHTTGWSGAVGPNDPSGRQRSDKRVLVRRSPRSSACSVRHI